MALGGLASLNLAGISPLEKLKIRVETTQGHFTREITALFNPREITISKSVHWRVQATNLRDTPDAQFTNGDRASLSMDLFFDTYEDGTNVRRYTDQVARLTYVNGDLHRPPLCQLVWGHSGAFQEGLLFQGVLENLTQRFTLFLADGTPVRATLGCTFVDWRSEQEEARTQMTSSPDRAKTRTVQRGDTLSSIAAEVYHDPTQWRVIAAANGITNPRLLTPGQVLAVPPLLPGQGQQR